MSLPNFPSARQYPFIDGLRAIAILLVLTHHARRGFDFDHLFQNSVVVLNWIYFNAHKYFNIDLTSFYYFIRDVACHFKGVLGMEIFFVISGFLITTILLKGELKRVNAVDFYRRRFFKIYPSYVIMVLASLVVLAWQEQKAFIDIVGVGIRHLLLLQNYFSQEAVLGHTWSMVIIEQFYLFSPAVCWVIIKLFKSVEDRRRALIILCLLLIVSAHFVRWYYFNTQQAWLSWPLASPIPYWTTSYHLDALAAGVLLKLLGSSYQGKLPKKIAWALWGFGFSVFYYLFFYIDWSYYWGEWYLYSLGLLSILAIIIAAFNGVMVLTRLTVLQWIGRHSYGIYLWHYLILMFWSQFLGKVPVTVLFIAYLVTAILAGVISTKTIERYFLTFRERRA